MSGSLNLLRWRVARAVREEDGTATIPFILFLPFFMMLVISSLEMGILMLRNVMLERALDLSVRDLRLGAFTGDYDDFKQDVCDRAGIIPDCMDTLVIELRPVSTTTWAPLSTGPICVDRANPLVPLGNPFDMGAGDELMLIRACAKFDPVVPTTGLGFSLPKDNTGAYALVSTTAFVNEPEPGS